MNFYKSIFLLAVLSTLVLSCSDENDTNNEFGRLKVQLTDAPFPHDLVAEANVTVFKIDARYKGTADMEEDSMDSEDMNLEASDDKRFTVLMEDEIQVNLLELTNGVTQTMVDVDFPVGSYDLIRVYLKGIYVVLIVCTSYDLKVPSGEQSGIKIFIKPEINVNGGITSDLLLDFDVSKSFVAKGGIINITGFNFKPVIKVSNLSTAGTLKGMITEKIEDQNVGVEGVQVAVFIADTLNTTTFSDIDGGYMIMGLDAGSYTVELEKMDYLMQTVTEVQIDAANQTVLDFEIQIEE
mgnify:CR=1 FL=1